VIEEKLEKKEGEKADTQGDGIPKFARV